MSEEWKYDESSGSFRQVGSGHSRRDEGSDWFSWALIAFMFIVGLWPIGLFMLISKLKDDKAPRQRTTTTRTTTTTTTTEKRQSTVRRTTYSETTSRMGKAAKKVTKAPNESSKTARILQIVGVALMAIFGVTIADTLAEAISYGWYSYMLGDLIQYAGFFAGGAASFFFGRKMARRRSRIARYIAIMGERDYVAVEELMLVTGRKRDVVLNDIEHMLQKNLLDTGAFLDTGHGVLFRSADAYQRFLQERSKREDITPKEATEGYSGALRAIREANDRIPDPVFSEKLDHMEEIAAKIFKEVEAHPEKQKQASTFFDYYLPTTLKLLGTYTEFESAGIEGENLRQAKARIESIMDTLLENFEKQLDELYRSEAMDVDADIRVMEGMLSRDLSSVERDFGLELGGGAATQSAEDAE